MNKNEPVFKVELKGGLNAAVWKNDSGYTATIGKQYKKDNEWVDTKTYFPNQVKELRQALEEIEGYFRRNNISMEYENKK